MTSRKPDPSKENIISLFAEKPPHLFAPLDCPPAVARSAGQGRSLDRRPGALPLRGASTMAGWRYTGRIVFSTVFALCVILPPGASAYAQAAAVPLQPPRINAADPLSAFVSEAAHRFSIPEPWIRAVMQAESGGNANAVSPKGALGLMQLMPATYADMRIRYGLGNDPMQPHDNIIAGTAYLREMLDCYGMAGFLAAYNAGPAQYDAHLAGIPLPAETRAYVARLLPVIDGERNMVLASDVSPAREAVSWMQAPLFAIASAERIANTSNGSAAANPAVFHVQPTGPSESASVAGLTPSRRMLNSMFVPVFGKAGS